MVDDEVYLIHIDYFGLHPIVEPPQNTSLVEILVLNKLQLYARVMLITFETHSEDQRLCARTLIFRPHTHVFFTLFERAEKILSLLERKIYTCTNYYRVDLFSISRLHIE